jgi:choline dehydrogenase
MKMTDANNVVDHGEYEYIVVGAGSAGCVLANRLTQNPKIRVLLIDAGAKDDYVWVHVPVGYLYCINNPKTDWMFKTTPQAALNGRSLLYPRGKILGGSSSINGMIYMRGQSQDYDGWASATGDHSWRWDALLPHFKAIEDHCDGANEFHGSGGEWRVEKQRINWKILDTFKAAANEAGIPSTSDFNRGNNFGVSYFDVTQKNGWRLNAARAFIKPAARRENLTLITGATIEKLTFDGLKCTGIHFHGGDKTHTASITKEVLLSAGAIGSVQILERSGIGNRELLEGLGISTVKHLPGVGENLQDHLQIRMVYKVKGFRTLNTIAAHWWGKLAIALQFIFTRKGPMSMAPSQLGAFACSSDLQDRPNVQYHVQPLSLDKFGEPLHRFNAFTASICNLRPSSRGSVHISSSDVDAQPIINPNYLSTEPDRQIALESVALTRKILNQPAFEDAQAEEFKPGKQFVAPDELLKQVADIGTTIFHPVGTCKMGKEDDPTAVVDSELKVIGVEGLRVVDASVMPTITSGNTAAPTMMIAEKIARLLLQQAS